MLRTTIDLVEEFNASTGFTQSDEISLIFSPVRRKSPQDDNKQIVYEGRCQKTATLIAGFCSVRFLANLLQVVEKDSEGLSMDKLKRDIYETCFDARAFSLPNEEEVVHCINWRIKDVMRNSKNNLGFSHFNHKELERMGPKRILIKLKNEKGVDWNDMPEPYKYGCFVKRERRKEEVTDSKGMTRPCSKTKWVTRSLKIGNVTDPKDEQIVWLKHLGFMMVDKFLNNCAPDLQQGWTVYETGKSEELKRLSLEKKALHLASKQGEK